MNSKLLQKVAETLHDNDIDSYEIIDELNESSSEDFYSMETIETLEGIYYWLNDPQSSLDSDTKAELNELLDLVINRIADTL